MFTDHATIPELSGSVVGPTGKLVLFVVFVIFAAGFTAASFLTIRQPKENRLFHILTATVLALAMTSYLAMATGKGSVLVENRSTAVFREVYYARYIDWLFTTPLLLVSLAFLAGLSPLDTLITVLYDIGMIVTGVLGGLSKSVDAKGITAKWTWFTISCIFFLGIIYMLVTNGLKAAALRPAKTQGLFRLLGIMTLVLWTAYPFVFAVTEGAALISVDAEVILYAILDVSAKFVFGFMLLAFHSNGGDDDFTFPEWVVTPRSNSEGGAYGQIRVGED